MCPLPPEPPATSLPTPSLQAVAEHRLWVPCATHQTPTGYHFTYGDGYVSVLFSQIIPPSSSPRVQKPVLYVCVSLLNLLFGCFLFQDLACSPRLRPLTHKDHVCSLVCCTRKKSSLSVIFCIRLLMLLKQINAF